MIKKCLLLFATGCCVILAGCGSLRQWLNAPIGAEEVTLEELSSGSDVELYELSETDKKVESNNPIPIKLDEIKEVQEEHYSYSENCLLIHSPGEYVLSGAFYGNVVVRVYQDEVVHLTLSGAFIEAEYGPAIYIENAGKAVITMQQGTENVISDKMGNDLSERACIFSNADLTLNGSGELTVYGYYHDSIRSKDCVKIIGANVSVKAKNNGIRGNDGVVIEDSNIEIESEGMGIKAFSEKDFVIIKGGACKIIAGENAISAERYVSIKDCITDLYSVLEPVKCNGTVDMDKEEE